MLQKKGPTLLAMTLMLSTLSAFAGSTNDIVADPAVFMKKFEAYQTQQQNTDPDTVSIALGQMRGLSRSFTGTLGTLALNLRSGSFTATLSGLESGASYGLWLVDLPAGAPVSDLSQARWVKLAQIQASGAIHLAKGTLDRAALSGFEIDRVVLSRGNQSPTDVLASGSMNVLQKLFFSRASTSLPGIAQRPLLPLASLVPTPIGTAAATTSASIEYQVTPTAVSTEELILQGTRLFFQEKFGGNGRTCGTCHPARNNFTIDAAFISGLPADDPLFVAETNPALAQLERPALMRQFGLILENVDGLNDPTNKFVMRSVPHTLGMPVSLTPDQNKTPRPAAMTGWSGDGAPGTGSLREFAIGAVTQHFTKSLNRVVGQDFVLPNDTQLDAMEAFQLALGRSTDFNLAKITFRNASVANGQTLFVNGTGSPTAGGRCNACHTNGGALLANGQNANFNTHVEDVPHPARALQAFPHDGGFGQTLNASGTFGDLSFNTTSVVEAADTPPFFHNNLVNTLEGVVQFYTGPEFNNPLPPTLRFSFTPTQVTDVANFMRGLNTLQNIDQVRGLVNRVRALTGNPLERVRDGLLFASSNTTDAIRVLREASLYPLAVVRLNQARTLILQAHDATTEAVRTPLLNQALVELNAAQEVIAVITP